MKNLLIASFLILASVSVFSETLNEVDEIEQANLVIYRTTDNSAVDYRLLVDGKHIGKLKPNSAIKLRLSAGDHIISSNDRNKTKLKVVTHGDSVTYVRKDIGRRSRISLTPGQPTDDVVENLVVRKFVAQLN